MNLISAANPVFSDATGTKIDVAATFAEFGYSIPFTAAADDVTDYGRDIYARAKAGEFGPVAAYVPQV